MKSTVYRGSLDIFKRQGQGRALSDRSKFIIDQLHAAVATGQPRMLQDEAWIEDPNEQKLVCDTLRRFAGVLKIHLNLPTPNDPQTVIFRATAREGYEAPEQPEPTPTKATRRKAATSR